MKTQTIKKLKQQFIGQLFFELRQLLEQTQEELANSLGVSFLTISRWEMGLAEPSYVMSIIIEKIIEQGKERKKLIDKYSADFSN